MPTEKKYNVFTPNRHFTGQRNGVQFTDGKGRATEREAAELVEVWGYDCPELFDVSPDQDGTSETLAPSPEANGSRAIEPWQSAVKAVKEIDNAEDLKAFTVDEDRDIVLKARDTRLEELAEAEDDSEDDDSEDETEPAEDDSEQDNSEEDKGSE